MAGFGIWPTVFQGSQFNADKAALADAINEFGSQWLVGVSVGNEALRTGYKSEDLATEIWAVRELLENMGIEGVVVGLNDNEVCAGLEALLKIADVLDIANHTRSHQ